MPAHLRPTAELAPRVLLPGDPERALWLAQALLREPRMFNHQRGLWGYTGEAEDGRPMTIQATGMGGPSAAIVVSELADLGARTVIRVGTCGALDASLALGSLVVATEAIATDGTSRALGAGDRVDPDAEVLSALQSAAPDAAAGAVVTVDLFYAEPPEVTGALAVEMEAATVLRVAQTRGLRGGCVLAVSDVFGPEGRERIGDEELEAAGESVGRVGAEALLAFD